MILTVPNYPTYHWKMKIVGRLNAWSGRIRHLFQNDIIIYLCISRLTGNITCLGNKIHGNSSSKILDENLNNPGEIFLNWQLVFSSETFSRNVQHTRFADSSLRWGERRAEFRKIFGGNGCQALLWAPGARRNAEPQARSATLGRAGFGAYEVSALKTVCYLGAPKIKYSPAFNCAVTHC